jgi:hypothetical protein
MFVFIKSFFSKAIDLFCSAQFAGVKIAEINQILKSYITRIFFIP